MPLNPSVLATLIKVNIDTTFPIPPDVPPAQVSQIDIDRQKLADAIANAVVLHLTTTPPNVSSLIPLLVPGPATIPPGTPIGTIT